MASPISQLKGTALEVAAKTYAQGLLIWNETAKRFHGGDGVTAGGIPMARYDERNDGSLGYEQRIETDASNAVTVADLGKAIIGNRATAIAFNLDPAASLTSKFTAVFKNIGAGTMSIVPNGAQLIDGVNAAVTLPTGASVVLKGDGTSLRTYLSNADVTGAAINNAPPLTGANLADTDKLGVFDLSAAALVGMTIAEFVAGLFSRAGAAINALVGKTTPVDADLLLLGDSAASFASKKLTFANLKTQFLKLTAFASFTPTITGFGTVTSPSLFWKMVDGLMYIEGTFVSGTPQTSPGVQARIDLPSGYQVDPTRVPSIRHFGTAARGAANSAVYTVLGTGGQTYLTIGRGDVSNNPLSSTTGDLVAASGNTVSINAIVPVTTV
jgi:hypothetical protein